MELWNFGNPDDDEEGIFLLSVPEEHDMSTAQGGLDVTKDVTSWKHSCCLNKGSSEKLHSWSIWSQRQEGKPGEQTGRHRCVGAEARSSALLPPTPGGLLSAHQHLLMELLCAESRDANLKLRKNPHYWELNWGGESYDH